MRVNYELRQLTVAGIVDPLDISLNNTVAYDRIAEARISYGGRGRQSDVQQPAWGQQIYDAVRPSSRGADDRFCCRTAAPRRGSVEGER